MALKNRRRNTPLEGLFSTAGRLDDRELMTATLSIFVLSASNKLAVLVFLVTERLEGLGPPFSSRRSILTGLDTDPQLPILDQMSKSNERKECRVRRKVAHTNTRA